jgi:DNA end-binding protein Ku
MRTKEYLAAIRARDGALLLTTMLFHDEIRPAKPIPTGGKKPSKQQLDHAVALIEELSTDWEPDRYEDCYRERLMKVIERKRKRLTIEAPKPQKEPSPADDLMEALKRSLENVATGSGGRSRS